MKQESKMIHSLEPIAASALLKTGNRILLDVRTTEERELASIPSSLFIPLHELHERYNELPTDKEIIVYCHHGSRSFAAAEFLQEKGIKVKNLQGGIAAWSYDIDTTIPRY